MEQSIKILTGKEASELLKGKTIERIVNNGADSQIIYFTDGTKINIFNDWFNGEGLKYQLLS
jgi:hypothetical protein